MFKQGSNLTVVTLQKNEKKPNVEIMDEDCYAISKTQLNIPEDYDFYWGTILGEDNYYYTMVGYDNLTEDPNKTVIKIHKINTNGSISGTAEIKGRPSNMGADQNMYASIRTPFKGSAGAMKWVDGKLHIHIGKEGFTSDGTVHQANISYTVDTSNMLASFGINGKMSYVSHSFNQKIIYDNGKAVTIDHGDAYPRALRLSVFGSTVETKDIFGFTGDLGNNKTYHKVTGLEQTASKYFIVGKSFPHSVPIPGYPNFNGNQSNHSYPQIGNIYLITVDKTTLEYTHKWITINNPSSNGKAWSEPRLVPIGNDRFILLYGYANGSDIYTQYYIVEADGTVSEPVKIEPMLFNTPIQPIIVGNSLYWLNIQSFEAFGTGAETGYNEIRNKALVSKLDITNVNKPIPIQPTVNVSNNGEQFDLPLGETYYFDMSAYLAISSGMIQDLPDTTLHYVPFTYAGTVNAYNLASNTRGNTEATKNVVSTDRSLFVSDYHIYRDLTWNSINSYAKKSLYDIKFGMPYENNFIIRAPSGGGVRSTNYGYALPRTNEWDAVITKNSSYIKNWQGLRSWCHDNNMFLTDWYAVRGGGSPILWSIGCNSHSVDLYGNAVGYRPVLEVDSSKLTARNSLKAVTLDLTYGSLKGNKKIKIVSAGSTFKAPSALGLTTPSGTPVNANTSFSWNTNTDGSGQKYLPGVSVPSSVTTLYADWGLRQQLAKVTIGSGKITNIDYSAYMQVDIIFAFYKDGKLLQVKRQTVSGTESVGGIDIPATANSIKVMMWADRINNLQPFGLPIEVIKTAGGWPALTYTN